MSVPDTTQSQSNKLNTSEGLVKFYAPLKLKSNLQKLANERNISLSAMMRLIASEYLKRHQTA